MNHELEYIPYRSRRNKVITNDRILNLFDEFSYKKNQDFVLNTKKKINLEIGFGSGEFILNQAKENTDNIYIGSEVYNPGIVKLICKLESDNINNVFVYQGDVRELLKQTSDQLFSNIYILFPDPWPKKKHHKRRLINNNFLRYLISKFKENLFIVTDDLSYSRSIHDSIESNNEYVLDEIKISNQLFFKTKFEKKAIQQLNNIFNFTLSHKKK